MPKGTTSRPMTGPERKKRKALKTALNLSRQTIRSTNPNSFTSREAKRVSSAAVKESVGQFSSLLGKQESRKSGATRDKLKAAQIYLNMGKGKK